MMGATNYVGDKTSFRKQFSSIQVNPTGIYSNRMKDDVVTEKSGNNLLAMGDWKTLEKSALYTRIKWVSIGARDSNLVTLVNNKNNINLLDPALIPTLKRWQCYAYNYTQS